MFKSFSLSNFFSPKKKADRHDPFMLSINDYFEMQKELKSVPAGPAHEIESAVVLAKYLLPQGNDITSMPANDAAELLAALNVKGNEVASDFPKLPGYKVYKKMNQLSIAQFIDLQMSINKVETNPEYMLSVFIVPEGHKYNDGYDADEHVKWIRNNVPVAYSNYIINFFLKWYLKSMRRILLFSRLKTVLTRVPKNTVDRSGAKAQKTAEINAYDKLITQIEYMLGFA